MWLTRMDRLVRKLSVLTLSTPRKKIADDILKYLSYFPQKTDFIFHANCLHWRHGDNLQEMSKPVFGENKKNVINLSSAELAHRVVKVNI